MLLNSLYIELFYFKTEYETTFNYKLHQFRPPSSNLKLSVPYYNKYFQLSYIDLVLPFHFLDIYFLINTRQSETARPLSSLLPLYIFDKYRILVLELSATK